MTKPAREFEYWFHEDDNYSEAAAALLNKNSGFGEHKHKCRKFIEYAEVEKWQARCASLEAECAALRQSIAFQACENWPMSITCFDEANRIRDEREAGAAPKPEFGADLSADAEGIHFELVDKEP